MKKTSILLCAIITGISQLTACSSPQPEPKQQPATTQQLIPEPPQRPAADCYVALKFINDYVLHCLPGAERMSDSAWVATNELATAGFKAAYKKLYDDAFKADPEMGMGADPIFDAQDFPDKGFNLVSCDADSGYVVVTGKNWKDFNVVLRVVQQDNKWLVDGAGVINIPYEKMAKR